MLRLYGLKVRVGILLLLSLLLPLPLGSQDAPSETVSGEAGLPEGLSFQFKEGLLSVDIEEVSLDQVLRAIAEEAGIELVLSEPPEEKISVEFTGLSMDKGLKRLLRGRGYLLVYGVADGGLKAVEVYSRDNAVESERGLTQKKTLFLQGRPEAGKKFQQLASRALEDPDPVERWRAVEDLASDDNNKRAAEILTRVLETETDANVRQSALDGLADFDGAGEVPLSAAKLALKDPAQEIRLQGVEILLDLEAWEELMTVARSHEDPEVRKTASEALDEEQ